jgi:ferredoxin
MKRHGAKSRDEIVTESRKTSRNLSLRDPLVLLGFGVLLAGILLLVYGFIPLHQPSYKLLAFGSVPINDTSGNIITNPENYFQAQQSNGASMDLVQCYPGSIGWNCFGYQQTGTIVTYDFSSRYYGGIMAIAGFLGVFAGIKISPFKQKPSYTRPLTVRVDEGICVSNSVCVSLVPTVFQLKKQDTLTIFAPVAMVVDPLGADNDSIIQAAQMCPTGAIIIEDEETGERIHPPFPKN